MPGAGSSGAGTGFAGGGPIWVNPGRPVIQLPRALQYQPKTRSFVQNSDGQMADVHPIDQAVAFLLFNQYGSSPSQPTLGTRILVRIGREDPRRIPSIVEDEVRVTLKQLIDLGYITLLGVQTDTSTPGNVRYAVTYVNNLDPNNTPRLVQPVTLSSATGLQNAA